MCNIYSEISSLINYGIAKGLIEKEDKIYTTNKVLEVLRLFDFEEVEVKKENSIEAILNNILDWAVEKGLIEDNITERDLLDTKIMGVLLARPSEIIREFKKRYEKSPKEATDYYYNLSKASNYIRVERVKKDLKWKADTNFGKLDITINMSKPEKDPKEIAKALTVPQGDYPKCLLCKECEGYEGRLNYPARGNHRIIPLNLNNKEWFLQYSPYVYFNEHSIVLKGEHSPMEINKDTFIELLEFVSQFKHYFIGSNADLPIVGGSILTHDHYQSGNYKFPLDNARVEEAYTVKGFEGIEAQRIKWPLSVIRLRGENKEELVELSNHILTKWRGYSDEECGIYSHTGNVPHNTITPISRFKDGKYEMDLVLRNNITTEEHPLGVFHPHKELHHIKKENIGLIEVMGLAVLPSRLMVEINYMKEYLLNRVENECIDKHKEWLDNILINRKDLNNDTVEDIIKEEIGIVFSKVLEHCGVFKETEKGIEAFNKFIKAL
ncbi:MAG: UDP-glucose--hexose-1-phosphate uridylyltransferase [Clostridium sp.]